MVTLSVIIVNYNVRDFLEQALLSAQKALAGISHEIFVVDNASMDGSVHMLRKKFGEVIVIENKVNVGFARANNTAIRRSTGRYISLLNPDTLVREDTFSTILRAFDESPDAGMIGCKVLNPDGTLQLSCRRSFPTPWVAITRMLGLSYLFPKSRLFGRYNMTYLDPDAPARVDAISGSFMTVRREVIETVGYLDEQFFMYGEDLDWCYQIKKFGWEIHYCPQTSIIHYKGESSRVSHWNQLKVFYDAMVIFSEKHFKSYHFLTPLWLLKISIWLRALAAFTVRTARAMLIPAVDLAFINGAILLAFFIRFRSLVALPLLGDYRDYLLLCGTSSLILLAALFIHGVYPLHRYSVRRSLAGALWGSMLAALFIFFSRQLAVSRIVIVVSAALQILFLAGWRFLLKLLIRLFTGGWRLPFGDELRPIRSAIIGSDAVSREIYRRFMKYPGYAQQIVGLVSTETARETEPDKNIPVLGTIAEIREIIRKHHITDIIFAAASHSYERIIDTITLCQPARINFKLVPTSLGLIIGKSSVVPIGDVPLVEIEYRYFEGVNRLLKRMLDIALAGLLAAVTLPAYIEEKIRKRLRSRYRFVPGERGAPLYIRQVMKDSKPYEGWARLYPLWLHILKGEISFIGSPLFTELSEERRRITLLKPGIISPDTLETKPAGELRRRTFELTYLKNYTILYDLKILYRVAARYLKHSVGKRQ